MKNGTDSEINENIGFEEEGKKEGRGGLIQRSYRNGGGDKNEKWLNFQDRKRKRKRKRELGRRVKERQKEKGCASVCLSD